MPSDIIFQLHSPEEFRYLSSLGHWVVGYIFLGLTIIAFLQSLGFLATKKYLWPALIVLAGVILIPLNLLHHSIEQLPLVWKVIELDPQQRQHFIMFNLIFLGGVVELLVSLKKFRADVWRFIWPTVLIVIGLMFLFHPQHGSIEALAYSVPYHRTLGTVLVLSGVFRTLEIIWQKKYKIFTFGWIVFLFIASILLVVYNEPKGVYEIDSSAQHKMLQQH